MTLLPAPLMARRYSGLSTSRQLSISSVYDRCCYGAGDYMSMPDYPMSLLDKIARECAAADMAEFLATMRGRWFVLQQRWKLEAAIQEATDAREAGSKNRSFRGADYRSTELHMKLDAFDRWVEDPRQMYGLPQEATIAGRWQT